MTKVATKKILFFEYTVKFDYGLGFSSCFPSTRIGLAIYMSVDGTKLLIPSSIDFFYSQSSYRLPGIEVDVSLKHSDRRLHTHVSYIW